jgi:hypothetical protein
MNTLDAIPAAQLAQQFEQRKPLPCPYDDPLHMMEQIGGGFIKSLVRCYYMADERRKAKLREAFADDFERYERNFAAASRRPA